MLSVVVSTARYCTYREVADTAVPEPLNGVKVVHEPSGVAVLPKRALSDSDVFAGVDAVQLTERQLVDPPASSTREVNVPGEAYGLIRIQSTTSAAPPVL